MKGKWRRGKLRSDKKNKERRGKGGMGRIKGKRDRGAEVKEREEEDISHRYQVVVTGVCDNTLEFIPQVHTLEI